MATRYSALNLCNHLRIVSAVVVQFLDLGGKAVVVQFLDLGGKASREGEGGRARRKCSVRS